MPPPRLVLRARRPPVRHSRRTAPQGERGGVRVRGRGRRRLGARVCVAGRKRVRAGPRGKAKGGEGAMPPAAASSHQRPQQPTAAATAMPTPGIHAGRGCGAGWGRVVGAAAVVLCVCVCVCGGRCTPRQACHPPPPPPPPPPPSNSQTAASSNKRCSISHHRGERRAGRPPRSQGVGIGTRRLWHALVGATNARRVHTRKPLHLG